MNSMINNGFWNGKSVFITGHTGFKGSWLSLWLQNLGACLIGYSLPPPTEPSLFDAANVGEGMKSLEGDIRNLESLSAAMAEAQPELVFHLAAQPLVRYSYSHPIQTYTTNVLGTANVLEATRKTPSVRVVVVVTSDKCYENKEWHYGYSEADPLGGHDPYSSSKACAELVTNAYRLSFFHPGKFLEHRVAVASARAGNVIGGGDWALDRLVPDLVTNFMQQKVVRIRSPRATRPWQHVLEPLSGYLSLAQRLYVQGSGFASAFNFGPHDQDCQDVEFVVRHVQRLWGSNAKYEVVQSPQPHEVNFLKLDSSKAHNELQWWPQWNIIQAIERTVEWYKFWRENKNTHKAVQVFTNEQIESYAASL